MWCLKPVPKKPPLGQRREKKKKLPILSQEAYHWSPKYTLEPQFDSQPEKGFQNNGGDLVKWEMPLVFKAINTWATKSHHTLIEIIYVRNDVLLFEWDRIISNCMCYLEILGGTEKSPALQFYNWMFTNLWQDSLPARPFIYHISRLYQPQDVFLLCGVPGGWAMVSDTEAQNDGHGSKTPDACGFPPYVLFSLVHSSDI